MRYLVASTFAVLLLLGFPVLAGGGHGWVAGSFSCLVLAPIAFAAWLNALGGKPGPKIALSLFALGSIVLALTAVATLSEGTQYFFGLWRVWGLPVTAAVGLVYFNWVGACVLIWRRSRAPS
jgi:hypothetical protein